MSNPHASTSPVMSSSPLMLSTLAHPVSLFFFGALQQRRVDDRIGCMRANGGGSLDRKLSLFAPSPGVYIIASSSAIPLIRVPGVMSFSPPRGGSSALLVMAIIRRFLRA